LSHALRAGFLARPFIGTRCANWRPRATGETRISSRRSFAYSDECDSDKKRSISSKASALWPESHKVWKSPSEASSDFGDSALARVKHSMASSKEPSCQYTSPKSPKTEAEWRW